MLVSICLILLSLYLEECSELVHELEDISKVYEGNVHDGTKYHEEYGVEILNLNSDKRKKLSMIRCVPTCGLSTIGAITR